MSREECFVALFGLLSGLQAAGTVKVCDRRVRLLEEMAPAELPALFLAGDGGQVEQEQGSGPVRTLGARVYLYAANPDRHVTAGTVLNTLVDAVEAALDPGWQGVQTLGGAVAHCWIEGDVEVFEGPQGERAAAIVPVKILMP
jgi:hypothetical protein